MLSGANILHQTDGTNTIWYNYGADGMLEGFTLNGNEYFYERNLQGDVVAILNGTMGAGGIALANIYAAKYQYDAWGKLLGVTDGAGNDVTNDPTHVGNLNPIRYRGYYLDTETGLYYLNSRYYDADTGRFVNADGLMSTGQGVLGCNLFSYCLNNPIVFFDPLGYEGVYIERWKNGWTWGMVFNDLNYGTEEYNDAVRQWNEFVGSKVTVDPVEKFNAVRTYASHGNALDIFANDGDPIYAAMGGKVITVINSFANDYNTYYKGGANAAGNYVLIMVWDGSTVLYGHMHNDIQVSEGQYVLAGTLLGYMGDTGNALGKHLHYQVNSSNSVVNYLPERYEYSNPKKS
jgi:RHS repeat-associated protein